MFYAIGFKKIKEVRESSKSLRIFCNVILGYRNVEILQKCLYHQCECRQFRLKKLKPENNSEIVRRFFEFLIRYKFLIQKTVDKTPPHYYGQISSLVCF